jgi:formylglycine-generating enzyme required for sulfatase activity
VRGAWHAPVAVFRWADGVLRAVAGEENVIVLNFLRMLAVVALVLLALVSVRMGAQWIENATALIPPIKPPVRPSSIPPQTIRVDLGDGVTMEMLLIPAGEFLMGSPNSDHDADADEKPEHQVRIRQPFYLGKYEVTQEQWEAVMGDNPSRFQSPKNPVEQVSWYDCQDFLERLNEKYRSMGATFRLPTEAEWEYACRAGSSTRWSFGDDEASLAEYGWNRANSEMSTHPIGQKRPNDWGLYDVHGNVWEWCADWYDDDYYGSSSLNDPKGPDFGRYRVLRGGSWVSNAGFARSTSRNWLTPVNRNRDDGLRVAKTCGDEPSTPPVPKATEPLRITPIPAQTVEGPDGQSDQTSLTITVTPPLRIRPIPPQTVEAGRPLTVAASVENPGYWEGKVRYSLGADAPTNATIEAATGIDAATGMFAWTPSHDQWPRIYRVTVLAAGPDGQSDEESFVVTVTAAPKQAVTSANEITVDLGGGVTMELVLIPAGEFRMGSPDSDDDADDEKPQHQVRITRRFYLGKYEVTQQQWEPVMGDNPSEFKGPRNPVERVSWDDCQDFLRRLNRKHTSPGATFRLPTEAEWEYACRAGSTTRWCFGDEEARLGEYAWYNDNSERTTHPVGQKKGNAWALYDMHGNVWEWCADWYEGEYYGSSPSNDPKGPNSGRYRVRRGGSWSGNPRYTRSADRAGLTPDDRNQNYGFRVARTP